VGPTALVQNVGPLVQTVGPLARSLMRSAQTVMDAQTVMCSAQTVMDSSQIVMDSAQTVMDSAQTVMDSAQTARVATRASTKSTELLYQPGESVTVLVEGCAFSGTILQVGVDPATHLVQYDWKHKKNGMIRWSGLASNSDISPASQTQLAASPITDPVASHTLQVVQCPSLQLDELKRKHCDTARLQNDKKKDKKKGKEKDKKSHPIQLQHPVGPCQQVTLQPGELLYYISNGVMLQGRSTQPIVLLPVHAVDE
jgi:hypothetical protein